MRFWLPRIVVVVTLAACTSLPDGELVIGSWRSTGAPATLRLSDGRWTLDSGGFVKSGVYRTSGDRLALVLEETSSPAFDIYCREAADVYRWDVGDRRLVILPLDLEQICDDVAAAVLAAGPWERAG